MRRPSAAWSQPSRSEPGPGRLGPAGRDGVQGIDLPAPLIDDYQRRGVFAVIGARTFHRGTDTARLLARAHPSGRWVGWLSPGTTWNG